MAGITLLVLAAESLLAGMRIVYMADRVAGKELLLRKVWGQKRFFAAVLLCLLVLGLGRFAFGLGLGMIRVWDLVGTYFILAVVDWKCQEVPDPVLLCFFTGQLLLGTADAGWRTVWAAMIHGIIFSLLILLFAGFTKGKFGMGDGKLLSVTALTAGWGYALQILCMAFSLAFFYSIWLLVFRKCDKKAEFPFVPFLFAGAVIQLVYR